MTDEIRVEPRPQQLDGARIRSILQRFLPLAKRIAQATPTEIDDLVILILEKVIGSEAVIQAIECELKVE